MSNADENKIVTGVRFVKKKGVIHLEVEQAKATEEGKLYGQKSGYSKRPEPIPLYLGWPKLKATTLNYNESQLNIL